jgi:regulator of protease activity HflC (stomatin/prohibitin superfamily)
MFDKLIDVIVEWIKEIIPFVIVPQYEDGIILRFGKYNKTLSPGIYFKIPFFDEILTYHTVMTTLALPPQSLYTIDKQNVVVKGVVKYSIVDVKTFLLEVYDAQDAISDMTQGIIKNIIISKTLEECTHTDIDSNLTKKVRSEIKKWGVDIQQVTLTDVAPIRTIRLINDPVQNKIN